MRFFLLMMLFGLVALTLDTTWLSDFPARSLRFDLIIVAVAALSFSFEWKQAVPVIVFYGILTDAASSAPFGMSIFSYLVIYGFIRAIIAKISFQEGLGLLFWVAIVSLMNKLLSVVVLTVAGFDVTTIHIILNDAPSQAIFDAVVGLGLVPFLRWYWGLSWEEITRPKGLVD